MMGHSRMPAHSYGNRGVALAPVAAEAENILSSHPPTAYGTEALPRSTCACSEATVWRPCKGVGSRAQLLIAT